MGFFLSDGDMPTEKPQLAKKANKRPISSGGTGCDSCALKTVWPSILSPRMPLSGNTKDPEVLFLGGNASDADDRKRGHFQGSWNEPLLKTIPARWRDRIAFQNIVRCFPHFENGNKLEIAHACSPHLIADIAGLPIKHILGIGDLPLKYLIPGASVASYYGVRIPIKLGERLFWYWPVHDPHYAETMKNEWDDGPVMPLMKADIKRFFSQCDKWDAPNIAALDPKAVLLPTSLDECLDILARMQEPLGIDIETNETFKPMIKGAHILCAAISDGDTTFAFPIHHIRNPTSWGLELLLSIAATRRWIAHNASFELMWFIYWAQQIGHKPEFMAFDDTMAQARLYFESPRLNALEDTSQVLLGVDSKSLTEVKASVINSFPLEKILPYCGLDAQASALIHRKIKDKVKGENYERLIASVKSTAWMELLGLTPDLTASAELRAHWQNRQSAAVKNMGSIYEVREFERNKQIEFNMDSPNHVGTALAEYGRINLPKTVGGKQFQSDEAALRKYAPNHPLSMAILAHREAAKLISTYIEPIERAPLLYSDGLVHPGYSTMLTKTFRLSSSDPNIQNFPKRKHKELRRQIIAPPGHIFLAFDYGQLEARVIAMATRDRNLCDGIIKGRDIHSDWLNKCLDIHPDYLEHLAYETGQIEEKKIRKYGRDIIKTDFVFASFFGSTAKNISTRTKIPLDKVNILWGAFWKEFEGVKKKIKFWRNYYQETGSSVLLSGQVRHEILMGNEPINTPIQGAAANIVISAMNILSERALSSGDMCYHPRINIHDDLLFILPDDDRMHQYIIDIMDTMVEIRFDWQIVPLMVEARVGYSWESLEEFTTHTGPYIR